MYLTPIQISDETREELRAYFAQFARAGAPMSFYDNTALLQKVQVFAAKKLLEVLKKDPNGEKILAHIHDMALSKGDGYLYLANFPVKSTELPPTPDEVFRVPMTGNVGEYIILGLSLLTGKPITKHDDLDISNVIRKPDAKKPGFYNYEPWHTHPEYGIFSIYCQRNDGGKTDFISAQQLYDNIDPAQREALLKPLPYFKGEDPVPFLIRDTHGNLAFHPRVVIKENYDRVVEDLLGHAKSGAFDNETANALHAVGDVLTDPEKHGKFTYRTGSIFLVYQSRVMRSSPQYEMNQDPGKRRWLEATSRKREGGLITIPVDPSAAYPNLPHTELPNILCEIKEHQLRRKGEAVKPNRF